MKTPNTNEEKSDTVATDMESLSEQIEAAIDEMDRDETEAAPADDSQEQPSVAEDKGEAAAEETKEDTPAEPKAIDDALVERAVKAGISLSDARSFASSEVLERIVASMETKADTTDAPKGDEDNAAAGEDHDVSGLPPELSEDDGYDPGIVSAFNAMRSMVQKQSEVIATLSRENLAGKADSYFNSLVGTLDESVQKGLDESARTNLRDKFELLVAGYRASGQDKNIKDVFAEAAKLALGDAPAKAAAAKRADALEKRKGLALAKPGSERAIRKAAGDDDGMSELVDILNSKFGG
jgi:hypothetical protein